MTTRVQVAKLYNSVFEEHHYLKGSNLSMTPYAFVGRSRSSLFDPGVGPGQAGRLNFKELAIGCVDAKFCD